MLGTTIEFDANNLAHNNAIILTIKGGKVVVLGHEQDLIAARGPWTRASSSSCC